MRAKIDTQSEAAEKAVRDIRRATRRHFSAEDKVRIVIAGLRGEDSVAELCRKEGKPEPLLPLVEGFPGGGQEAAGRRYRA
jgi:transposase